MKKKNTGENIQEKTYEELDKELIDRWKALGRTDEEINKELNFGRIGRKVSKESRQLFKNELSNRNLDTINDSNAFVPTFIMKNAQINDDTLFNQDLINSEIPIQSQNITQHINKTRQTQQTQQPRQPRHTRQTQQIPQTRHNNTVPKNKPKEEVVINQENTYQSLFDNDEINKMEAKEKLTLSFILNLLDGILETPGRILIMTTNHPEKLDKALIRPGRIDLNIQFTKANKEMVKDMFKHFYDTILPGENTNQYKYYMGQLERIEDNKYTPAEVHRILFENFENPDEFIQKMI
jgi:SpoVK/Ycf46/Vps4 family AAA+-type ATPase